jgi:ATP-binding cassette subfamily C protein LapB
MDEPSNSMDNTTEEKLLAHLEAYLKGKTLLLVTHRASMLKLVDRILVIEKGHIIADGPKDVVINAMKDGSLGMRT